MVAGSTAPTGWLLCDGTAVSRTTYSDLFAITSTTYGIGDNSTTFNLPNLKGKVAVGRDSSQTEFNSLGETGGDKEVTLTGAQSGTSAHLHAFGTLAADIAANTGTHTHTYTETTDNTGDSTSARWDSSSAASDGGAQTIGGGGHDHTVTMSGSTANSTAANATTAHTNLQPYIVLNYIIKT
jgi:microcystin-dependent protein